MHDLKSLFSPRSIAVVGASTRPESVGRALFENLRLSGFKGKIFPVNPKVKRLGSLRCYSSLSEIQEKIDLALIAVPAILVPDILREAGRIKIKAAVIISAGFKEAGRNDLEQEIVRIAKHYHLTLLGPNCLGFIRPRNCLNATFASVSSTPGSLAFLSQSGALGTAFLDKAQSLSLGVSLFASVGNKAILDEADIINYLQTDKSTKVLGLYVEQFSRPEILGRAIRRFNRGAGARPVVVLKAGATAAGAQASVSHTGAMAGNDEIYQAFFRDNSIIRADSMSDFFDYLQIFTSNKIVSARRLAIITNAGGPGVLAADAASRRGLILSQLGRATLASLKKNLPAAASMANPIDILGDASPKRYLDTLKMILTDDAVESILILVTPQSMTKIEELAEILLKYRRSLSKPLAICLMGGASMSSASLSLRRAGLAVFDYPEQAVAALAVLADFYDKEKKKVSNVFQIKMPSISWPEKRAFERVTKIFAHLRSQGIKEIPEFQALEILRLYDLPVPKFFILRSQADAARARKIFSEPLALKIASYDILHKDEVGGVSLDVKPENLVGAYKDILARVKERKPGAAIEGVLVMPMVSSSLAELIVGSVSDSSFGHSLMIGWGGIYTETIKDVSFTLLPLTLEKIRRMLSTLSVGKILLGSRGQKPADFQSLVRLLFTLERLLFDFPEIKEIDLNPVAISADGLQILDARLILS